MGGLFSTPSTNSSEIQTHQPTISAPKSSQTPESKTLEAQTPMINTEEGDQEREEEEEEEEEEEGECGFCVFMKGGGCRDSFTDWENCVTEGEKNNENVVKNCSEFTGALMKCMVAHSDYYHPVLKAEKAAKEEAVMELEKEKDKKEEASQEKGGNS